MDCIFFNRWLRETHRGNRSVSTGHVLRAYIAPKKDPVLPTHTETSASQSQLLASC